MKRVQSLGFLNQEHPTSRLSVANSGKAYFNVGYIRLDTHRQNYPSLLSYVIQEHPTNGKLTLWF